MMKDLKICKLLINNFGFTLIETLVSVVLIGTVGLIASISLVNLLTGSAKTETIKEIKQNGDYAISSMEQNIRNATNVYYLVGTTPTCTGGSSSSLTVVQPLSSTIIYSCTGSPTSLQVNGNSLTNNEIVVHDCSAVFSCYTDANNYKTVTIDFTLEDAKNSSVKQTYKTQINLRNK